MNLDKVRKNLFLRQSELESRSERIHRHIYLKEEPVSANFNEQIKQTENDGLVMALDVEGMGELSSIADALRRIEDGAYGKCEHCGHSIGEKRLAAIPHTSVCIVCANLPAGEKLL